MKKLNKKIITPLNNEIYKKHAIDYSILTLETVDTDV